jgi:malonyl CoA-acyl carrier protein transacylase
VRKLVSLGVTKFVEVGPGGVLCGLLKSIDSTKQSYKFGEAADALPAD